LLGGPAAIQVSVARLQKLRRRKSEYASNGIQITEMKGCDAGQAFTQPWLALAQLFRKFDLCHPVQLHEGLDAETHLIISGCRVRVVHAEPVTHGALHTYHVNG
jgi:hypothetical protein